MRGTRMSQEMPNFLAARALVYAGMALDPSNARAGVATYLLEAGPMPPTPRDLALARLHRALDGGAFEHPCESSSSGHTPGKSGSCARCHAPHSFRQL
jgi:hypothetical protein